MGDFYRACAMTMSHRLPEFIQKADIDTVPGSCPTPLVVVSPHYDDAVFSCGNLLSRAPHSTVLTVFTGLPEDGDLLTDWDRRCGFATARDAMRARAAENSRALACLRARGVELDFLDSQYIQSERNEFELLGDTLSSTLMRLQPAAVFFPLGLFHADHLYVSDVLATICPRFPAMRWFAYEDIPYSRQKHRVHERLGRLAQCGIEAVPFHVEGPPGYKEYALQAYRSQFNGLGHADARPLLEIAERYWRLIFSTELF